MTTVQDALKALSGALGTPKVGVEMVSLSDALGRRLARDVSMDHDVPPFDRVAMDGYALAEPAQIGLKVKVLGAVHAGDTTPAPLAPGHAVRVMTGAPAPAGTRSVVPFEWTHESDQWMEVRQLPSSARHIVPRGEHRRAGESVLRRGAQITASGVAALATAGCISVPVARRPGLTILGTGSELVPPDQAPGPSAIRNSNSSLLMGLARSSGASCRDLGFVEDAEAPLRSAIRRALDADVLCLSGGVSQGDRDLVPAALQAEGVEPLFHGWKVQPGGPLWVGRGERCTVFGLPGNPAAVLVGFELLVVPLLRALQGLAFEAREVWRARYTGPWGAAAPKRRFRPVSMATDPDGVLRARALAWEGSGDPFSFVAAQGLAVLPEGRAERDGEMVVDVIPLSEHLAAAPR